jgi:hypothetical protein
MLAAPRCSVCALAGNAKAPNTNTAALNVTINFFIGPSSWMAGLPEEKKPRESKVTPTLLHCLYGRFDVAIAGVVKHNIFELLKFRALPHPTAHREGDLFGKTGFHFSTPCSSIE